MNTAFLNKLADRVKNLDLNVQYGILGIVLFFIFFLNYSLIIRWEMGTIRKMNDTQLNMKNEILRLESDTKRLNQLKAELVNQQKLLDDPNIKFRSKNDIPSLIQEIIKIGESFDVRVTQLTPLNGPEELLLTNAKGKYWAVPLSLQARAGYHSLGKWLNQLEKERLLLNVKNLSIVSDDKNISFHNIQAVLRVVVMESLQLKSEP